MGAAGGLSVYVNNVRVPERQRDRPDPIEFPFHALLLDSIYSELIVTVSETVGGAENMPGVLLTQQEVAERACVTVRRSQFS